MLVERIDQMKREKIKVSPCHSNRASELGHECLRRLCWLRTRWQDQAPPDLGLQYIFDQGEAEEKIAIRDLEDAGIEVTRQQKSLSWPKYQITGHLDIKASLNGSAPLPVEIKSMAPWIWDGIETLADMIHSRHWWIRKYPAQMLLYLLLEGEENGLFLLKNKSTGRYKEVPIALSTAENYAEAEALIQKAERINAHVAAETVPPVPDGIDRKVCEGCSFYGLGECITTRDTGEGAELETDPEMEETVKRHEELKSVAAEYDDLHTAISKRYRGRQVMTGDFYISGSWRSRKGGKCTAGKDCPSYKEEFQEQGSWIMKIEPLKK